MSTTPRTDERAFDVGCDGRDRHAFGQYVESDFARELERENSKLMKLIQDLQSLNKSLDGIAQRLLDSIGENLKERGGK